MVRFTVQVKDTDVTIDPITGRVDRTKIQPEKIKQVGSNFAQLELVAYRSF